MSTTTSPEDGTPISYDVSGDGPTVVLLHGAALSKAIWRGLGYVRGLAGFRVVRMDLRGHGRSGRPHETSAYRMSRYVADVVAVLDAEGLSRAPLVGYSLGGRIAFAVAAAAPDRVTGLVTLGGTFRALAGEVGKLFFPGYRDALTSGRMEAFVAGLEDAGWSLDPATRQAFFVNDPHALAACLAGIEHDPGLTEADVAGIAAPALLMAGTRDRARLADARRAAELMPHARVVELPGRTHASTLAPAGPVLDQLLPFLRAAS